MIEEDVRVSRLERDVKWLKRMLVVTTLAAAGCCIAIYDMLDRNSIEFVDGDQRTVVNARGIYIRGPKGRVFVNLREISIGGPQYSTSLDGRKLVVHYRDRDLDTIEPVLTIEPK